MHSIKLIDESKPASVDNLQAVRLKQMYVADPQRTPADCERLAVHLYVKDKLSVGKIAREIGVHESTVYNILRRAGVKTRGKFVKKGKSYV
jgi:transposase-like protein